MENFKISNTFVVSVPHGSDLLGFIEDFAAQKGIAAAQISGIGAVQKAVVGYYDQAKREYLSNAIDEPMEISALLGNVSLKDSKPFPHIHISLAKKDGSLVGGHLSAGTIVFACEIIIHKLEGVAPVRGFDEQTGLFLWTK